jgi:glucosamine kinase
VTDTMRPAASPDSTDGGYVVGVDVGATKTHLAAAREGVVVSEQIVRTSTWRSRSVQQDAAALAGLVRECLGDDALHRPLAVGAHGCDTTAQCLALQRELAHHVSAPVRVVNDAELMPWSMRVSGGIGVVSGTGSIAVARDERDRLMTAGGWGWILGDEGGASGIVREATRAVLAELDRGRSSDPLTSRLLAGFDAADGAELAMALTLSSSAESWGGRAGEVFAAADEGSPVARRVIDEAADQLALLVECLLGRGVRTDQVVAGGAVIQAQSRLRDRFLDALKAAHPGITVSILDRAPVIGAIALAAVSPDAEQAHHTQPLTPEATS